MAGIVVQFAALILGTLMYNNNNNFWNVRNNYLTQTLLFNTVISVFTLHIISSLHNIKSVCVCPQETQRLIAEPVPGIQAEPDEGNARYFHVVITGPEDSPFEGGTFKLELFLPEEYPMAAPKVRFITKIYHPNVDKLGRICLDILKGKYTLPIDHYWMHVIKGYTLAMYL